MKGNPLHMLRQPLLNIYYHGNLKIVSPLASVFPPFFFLDFHTMKRRQPYTQKHINTFITPRSRLSLPWCDTIVVVILLYVCFVLYVLFCLRCTSQPEENKVGSNANNVDSTESLELDRDQDAPQAP